MGLEGQRVYSQELGVFQCFVEVEDYSSAADMAVDLEEDLDCIAAGENSAEAGIDLVAAATDPAVGTDWTVDSCFQDTAAVVVADCAYFDWDIDYLEAAAAVNWNRMV